MSRMGRIPRLVALVAMGAVILTSCQSASNGPAPVSAGAGANATATPKSGGTIKYALLRDPVNFEPHQWGGYSSIAFQGSIYDGLLEYDEKGQIRGALAEKWEQPDPLTYVFHLRQGVKFQDGTAFDAEDVKATFDRIKDPKTAAEQRVLMENVAKIETPDPFTVKVTLATPSAVFLNALARATTLIVSADDVKSGFTFKTKTNGTGAFILTSWEPGGQYVLKKNPNYWKKGLPYIDQLIEFAIPDDKARANALRTGEADFADSIPWQEYDALEKDGFNVYKSSTVFTFVRLNTSVAPLNNKKVREALNYVVDRDAILQGAFGGFGKVVNGPLQQEGTTFYWKDLENYYKKDLDKARALLVEAGYKTPAEVPPLEWSVVNLVTQSAPSQIMLQELQQFGLRVTYKTIDTPTLVSNRASGAYQMMTDAMGFADNDPNGLRQYFDSKAGTSFATGVKYKNDRLDQLLAQGAQTTNTDERKKMYREAEGLILDEAPWVFLNWRPSAEAAPKYVKDYIVPPGLQATESLGRWEYLWLDKNK